MKNPMVAIVIKMAKYIKNPYYETSSFKIRKELKNLLQNNFGYIRFKIMLTKPNRMKLFFFLRTRIEFRIKYAQALYIGISVSVVTLDITGEYLGNI